MDKYAVILARVSQQFNDGILVISVHIVKTWGPFDSVTDAEIAANATANNSNEPRANFFTRKLNNI